MLYELLTGELPLGRFDPPSRRSRLDRRVDAVVHRALEKEPERRYQSVSDLKKDLDSLANSGLRLSPPPRLSEGDQPATRGASHDWVLALHWLASMVGLFVAVVAGVLGAPFLWVLTVIGVVLPATAVIRHFGTARAWSYMSLLLTWVLMAALAVTLIPSLADDVARCLSGSSASHRVTYRAAEIREAGSIALALTCTGWVFLLVLRKVLTFRRRRR